MTLDNLRDITSKINRINKHQRTVFIDVRAHKNLQSFAMRHPIVLVGEIPPKDLVNKYNINTNERVFLFSQVSHNLKNHQKGKMAIDSNSEMSMNVLLLPMSTVKKNLGSDIFLKDRGNDTQQEENATAAFTSLCQYNINGIDADFYDSKTETFTPVTLDSSNIIIFQTRADKAAVYSAITGHTYDSVTGDIISPQPLSVPINPVLVSPVPVSSQVLSVPVNQALPALNIPSLVKVPEPPEPPNTPVE